MKKSTRKAFLDAEEACKRLRLSQEEFDRKVATDIIPSISLGRYGRLFDLKAIRNIEKLRRKPAS
jgi:hypothetical protein